MSPWTPSWLDRLIIGGLVFLLVCFGAMLGKITLFVLSTDFGSICK